MIKLPNKRELFAQSYAIGMSATQAYIEAGYSKEYAGPNSGKLLKDTKVSLRIKELEAEYQKVLREKTQITLENIVKELVEDREGAREQNNFNASIKANIELAKLHGLYEIHNKQKNPYAEMSDEKLDEEITKMEKRRAKKLKLVSNAASGTK